MNITVIGAGTMGHGIAQVAALAGHETILYDVQEAPLDHGLTRIRANLDKGVDRGKVTPEQRESALAALSATTVLDDAAGAADFIIEAAPERMDLKKRLVQEACAAAPDHAIFATNTSSLSLTEIAAAAPHPAQVVGMHFFNPVHIMKLLELVRAEQTTDATLDAARELGASLGKDVIVVNDSAGFATSRLGLVIGLEAIRMLEQGVASAEDIDKAMELGYRHPMGPLRLTDLVGLDVRLAIAEYLHAEIGEQFRPPQLLRKMVRAGRLGKKSGRGFYDWS
ncbi:MAG: 3-hydroxybutyryl-CoA dehydrogenase [Myxococcota bacterium]